MESDLLAAAGRLSGAELVERVRQLAARERGAAASLIAHLAALEARDLHLHAGHGSLFAYCRDVLALAEQQAYNFVAAARAARHFPAILPLLADGSINVTTVRLLAPHLTLENHDAVLVSARRKNKMQVEEIVARLCPLPDAPSEVRQLSERRSLAPARPDPSPPAAAPLARVLPLSPERYRLEVTIDGETLEKLRFAKDLLRHVFPTGHEAELLNRALTALLADLAQRKFAATDTPRRAAPTDQASRHVPAEVKRAVWLRDLGRCGFVGAAGRRCAERGLLEFHHVQPYAAGGRATLGNIELRCRNHNGFEARRVFGHVGSSNGEDMAGESAAGYA